MHCLMGILVFMIAEPILAQELFSISETGAVRLNGTSYKSMKDFIGSREFRESGRRCGHTMAASKRKINTNRSLSGGSRADCTNFFTAIKETYEPKVNISIPIWFHVISRSDGAGTISDQRIKDQIKVLNEDFLAQSGTIGADSVKTRIKFKLAGITRTVNNSWYTDSDADEIAYKQALGKNPNKFLNIYTNDARGFLGYAYLPSSAG
ncbi:MAG: hypothetical protein KTR16_15360, partial [Acidiferrobacterales bacterium]|nr:hypothetical protein [Acidiferrobacterales bacterium]